MNQLKKIGIKDFGISIFSVILITVLLVLVILPKYTSLTETKEALKVQEIEIDTLSRKLSDLRSLSEADLVSQKDLLLEALPPQKEIFFFMAAVKKIISDNNLTLEKFDFSPGVISTESGKEPKIQTMEVSVSGSFEDIKKFFENSEKTVPLFSFSPFKLTGGYASGSAQLSSFSLAYDVSSYYLPLPNYLGKINSPLPKITKKEQELIDQIKSYAKIEFPEEVLESVAVGKEIPF